MNFKEQRMAAAKRKPECSYPKNTAPVAGKPNVMSGSQGADVTMLDSNGNKRALVNTPAYINKSGRGGTSKNY